MENTMPPSPEPASAVKFADVPFTHSLGLAEYGIPIYTLEGRELTLSVGLHYSSGGIKMDEIAGVAGLGWKITAGGCVTRTVVDMPDEYSSAILRHQMPSGTLLSDLESMTETNQSLNYLRDVLWHQVDCGLDRYSYSICGLSGSFVIKDSGEVFQLSGDGIKIEYTRASDGSVDSFTFTGPDGTIYILSVKETAIHEGRGDHEFTPTSGEADRWSATTAWHLSTIRSRSGLEQAEFTYTDPIVWERDILTSRQTCNVSDRSTTHSTSTTFIACSYNTRYLTEIRLGGKTVRFDYDINQTRVAHTGSSTPAYNCPARLSRITVSAEGNPVDLLRADFGTARAAYDGRVLLKTLRFYRGDALDDKWDFSYRELEHAVSKYSQDWHGYYNGEHEYSDSGTNTLCPFELSARTGSATRVSGTPAPEYASYMSLTSINHDGAEILFEYEGNKISDFTTDYNVGVRVKSIIMRENLWVVQKRDFIYENPIATGPVVPTVNMYGNVSCTVGALATNIHYAWNLSLSERPVVPGPSILDTRVIYGKVTEEKSSSLLRPVESNLSVIDGRPFLSQIAKTVYMYSAEDCYIETQNYLQRFPSNWTGVYNRDLQMSIDPWDGIREGFNYENPAGKALLTRKEEYAWDNGNYNLVSSTDYTYDTLPRSSVLVDYHATQVMNHELYGQLNYTDIYHFPIYAYSGMVRNPIEVVHVNYHSSGNDTTVTNTKYIERADLSYPVRVRYNSITEAGKTRKLEYEYADTCSITTFWTSNLKDAHCLSVPLKESQYIGKTLVIEGTIQYSEITIDGVPRLLPSVHAERTAEAESWRDTVLSRDSFGNITSFKEKGQPEVVALWGYGGRLPVAVITNASVSDVTTLIGGADAMDALAGETTPSAEYTSILSGLRTALQDANVVTYTHIPGIGVSSMTDEAGTTTCYEYDPAGRLTCIKDHDGNKTEEHVYCLMSDDNNRRHMRTRNFLSSDGQQYSEDIHWWDTFGRKTQDISIAASGSGADLVTAYSSDFLFHDDVKVWLPYPKQDTGGLFQTDAESQASAYHNNTAAYTAKTYEVSDRDRVLSTALPGHDGVHITLIDTDVTFAFPRLEWTDEGITAPGTYSSGEIVVGRTTDPDGRIISEYKDHIGRTLGTSFGTDAPTYYVYDSKDRLRAVVNSGLSLTDTLSMWRYSYDALGRLASKGVPNSIREYYTYDDEDRVIAVSKGELLKEIEYDDFGRIVNVYMTREGEAREHWESHSYDIYPEGIFGENPKGLETCSRLAEINSDGAADGFAQVTFAYDKKKRPVRIQTTYSDNGTLTEEFEYTFWGDIQSSVSRYTYGAKTDELRVSYVYGARGRLDSESYTLIPYEGTRQEVEVKYEYDSLGRQYKSFSSVSPGATLESIRSYTLQGWVSGISARLNEADLFSQEIGFDQAQMPAGMLPQYGGKTSSITDNWHNNGAQLSSKSRFFDYDHAGRLSLERTNGTAVTYSYDPRSNILSESGPDRGTSYAYDGEKLISVNVSGGNQQSCSFAHDALGRMVYNGMTGQQISYNDLDLVRNIESNGTTLVNYSYLADGTKLSATDAQGEGLVYRGAFVYRRGADSSLTLESAGFSGGRLTGTSVLMYATDYLGSVRAVVDGRTGELYKAVDYSAYGEETTANNVITTKNSGSENLLETASIANGLTLRDGYTGKENQHLDFGTHYTDFGARQYHPQLHRWMTPDPLSEKYYGISPYAFCNNDPVNFVDVDGEDPTLAARMALGAAVGGAISGTVAIIKGKSFTEVVAATAGGAVDGAIGAMGGKIASKIASKLVSNAVNLAAGTGGGTIGNLVEQGINIAFGNQHELDRTEIAVSTAFGAMTGTINAAAETMGKHMEDIYSSDETVKSITKEIKDNSSKRMTNREATNEAKKVAEEAKKTEKILVEKSAEVVTYTLGFYNNLQDE